ncbi:hypothetical protein N7533_011821 [Penicillium manginii]|uniref:uncharacterized protein n=1 Tax=Penicillium manginii TaxID=203109 RepID=UPI00254711E1|nr:uncharacterized protein N7533_011821 [Penicillium manginii]KAJ5739037.1 hypothetical protein N7533_011821 [Penicillium manginii]
MDPSKSSRPSKPPNINTSSPTPMSPTPQSPTSPSWVSSVRPSRIPFPQLKERVDLAVKARNDGYAVTTALIVYWEDDDTGAEMDAKYLEKTFKDLLGIVPTMSPICLFKIIPPFTPLDSLFIFAYIGHGNIEIIHEKSQLVFASRKPGRYIRWNHVQSNIDEHHISTLAILDCCYSGFKGTLDAVAPAIQVFAACAGTEKARARGSNSATFTRRFCGELKFAQNHGESFINTEEMFERLRLNTVLGSPNPRLQQNGGVKPILLNIKKQLPQPRPSSPSRIPRPKPPKADAQHVVVKLTLMGPEAESIAAFQHAMLRLPEPFHVRLIDAFKTDRSSLVIMRMRWQTWARLSTVLELKPMGVITGESLLPETSAPTLSEVRRVGENLPLRPGPSKDNY